MTTAHSIKTTKRRADTLTQEVRRAFENAFGKDNVKVYRYNSASIRVRVIDEKFDGMLISQREAESRSVINSLSKKALADLTVVLLLSPNETKTSFMNLEFEDESRSRL